MQRPHALSAVLLIATGAALPGHGQIAPADPATINQPINPIGTLNPTSEFFISSVTWEGAPATFAVVTPQMGPITIQVTGGGLDRIVQVEAFRYVGASVTPLAAGHRLVPELVNASLLRLHLSSDAGSPSNSYYVRLRDATALAASTTTDLPPAPPMEPWQSPASGSLYEPPRNILPGEGIDLIIPALRLQFGDVASLVADWVVDAGQGAGSDTSIMYSVPPRLGFSVAAPGDVNGDGVADLLAGAPYFENGQTNEGRAQLHLGSPQGVVATPHWIAEPNVPHANLGHVAGSGDVNGDGYQDVLVRAKFNIPRDHVNGTFELRAYGGGANGPQTSPSWTYSDLSNWAPVAHDIAGAGDVNGDGFADVVAAVETHVGTQPGGGYMRRGHALVFHGSMNGLSPDPVWSRSSDGPALDADLMAVCGAGDVNGDGFDDLIVGEPRYHSHATGRARIFLGSPSGLATQAAWEYSGPRPYTSCGIGDVNGDGFDDIGLADPGEGAAMAIVFLGGPNGPGMQPSWQFASPENGLHQFGSSIAGAGDVNGDGFADIVVGGHKATNGKEALGRAFLFTGSPSGLSPRPVWIATGAHVDSYMGRSVALTRDPWGGPAGAVVVGSSMHTAQFEGEGRVYVFRGRQTVGPGAAPSAPPAATRLYRLPARHIVSAVRGGAVAAADVQRDRATGDYLLVLPNHRRMRVAAAAVGSVVPANAPRQSTAPITRPAPASAAPSGRPPAPQMEILLRSGEIIEAISAEAINSAGDLRLLLSDGSTRTVPSPQIGSRR